VFSGRKLPLPGDTRNRLCAKDSSAVRRGLLLVLLCLAAFGALPAVASADSADPYVVFSFQDGWFYPQGVDVEYGFFCLSPGSFIVSCEGNPPFASKLDTFHAGQHTVTVTATDYEGRQTIATQTYTVVDITKPRVIWRTPSEGAAFEQGLLVTVDFTCEDDPGGLGIIDGGCGGDHPPGYPLDTSRLGTFAFTAFAADKQFNVTQETIHYSVVDTTPPTITLASPADGATYIVGQQVSASFSCDDGNGSGMHGCKGDLADGSQLDTTTVGAHTFTVTAYDRAGNVARTTHSYSVVYDFAGFGSPAAAYPTAASVKAGEAVPLKFSLHGAQGADIFAAGSPGWTPCGALDSPTAADGGLSYNASTNRYTFLAATAKAWAGTCRDLVATFRDGTTHRARFTFTK
jgi:hypothetical protein